jgi:hypothetical protein
VLCGGLNPSRRGPFQLPLEIGDAIQIHHKRGLHEFEQPCGEKCPGQNLAPADLQVGSKLVDQREGQEDQDEAQEPALEARNFDRFDT